MSTAPQEQGQKPRGRPPGKAVAVKQEADSVRGALDRLKPQLALALPKHLTADRLCRVAMTAVQVNPKLLECDRTSFYSAIMTCAQLGLEPDGVLGQAYLVPFVGRVQFIPGYKGLITLARNSGEVVSISAHEVCEKDEFKFSFGLVETLHHIPVRVNRGEVIYFYAIARFKDGGHHFDVMSVEEVKEIRDSSQGYRYAKRVAKDGKIESPWEDHFVEMGKKTAIRRIAKYLPMSVQKAAAMADAYDAGRHAALDQHGDLHFPEEELQQIADQREEGQSTSKLEDFEKRHAGGAKNGEAKAAGAESSETSAQTAESADKPAATAGAEKAKPTLAKWERPEGKIPSKPKQIGGEGNAVAFAPWFIDELQRIPNEQVADFLSKENYGDWYDWLNEHNKPEWEKIEAMIAAKKAAKA